MKRRITIMRDPYPENPREYEDRVETLICFHRRYALGDKQSTYLAGNFKSWEDLKTQLIKDGYSLILPLYLYDHSGLHISLAPFSCPWDSGQVGFAVVKQADIDEHFDGNTEAVKEIIQNSVEEYDSYLSGEVYMFQVEEEIPICPHCSRGPDWKVIDTCNDIYSFNAAEAYARDCFPDAEIIYEGATL